MNKLWVPETGSQKASSGRNERVRIQTYQAEKQRLLGTGHLLGCRCSDCGRFRGDLARDWVRVAAEAGLKVPGSEARQPLREGETEEYRRVDAARTRLRQFESGQDQFEWVLVGIETTIADRRGMAYPAGAYQGQLTIDV